MSRGKEGHDIDQACLLWYFSHMSPKRHKASSFGQQPLAGYKTRNYSDMNLLINEGDESIADKLHGLLRSIFDERPDPDVLHPIRAGRGTLYSTQLAGSQDIVIRVYRHGGFFVGFNLIFRPPASSQSASRPPALV